jgi:hypothetical protein
MKKMTIGLLLAVSCMSTPVFSAEVEGDVTTEQVSVVATEIHMLITEEEIRDALIANGSSEEEADKALQKLMSLSELPEEGSYSTNHMVINSYEDALVKLFLMRLSYLKAVQEATATPEESKAVMGRAMFAYRFLLAQISIDQASFPATIHF